MSSSSMYNARLQSSGMLSREQLVYLFDRFALLTSQSDVKKRIADAVNDKQEAVAITTAIQEGIFSEMGVDPSFGLASLGKVNMTYENDQDLMMRFYKFVVNEEMACDEAELGQDEFAESYISRCKKLILTWRHQLCHRSKFKWLFKGGCLLYLYQVRLGMACICPAMFSDSTCYILYIQMGCYAEAE